MAPRLNMGPALRAVPTSPLRIFRPLAGARINGFFVDPGDTELVHGVRAHVYPARPAEVKFIAGGEGLEAAITIHSRLELHAANDDEGRLGDEVLWRGKRWKLMAESDYSIHGFFVYIAGRLAA